MPEKLQTRKNHARLDPVFHLLLVPGFTVVFVWAALHLIRHPGTNPALLFVFSGLLLLAVFRIRIYALKVQDRVIRLEERLRLASSGAREFASTSGRDNRGAVDCAAIRIRC